MHQVVDEAAQLGPDSGGISVLFSGPPGTGKTIAAEALAGELSVDLYRIDLSQVVNKYIGETEKNLARFLESAAGSGAILFFDEADALFGKRTEMKDSHDRYANMEVGHLELLMDTHPGISILAVVAKDDLDDAFLRRMRFIVEFPRPRLGSRRRLRWIRGRSN
jgi:SpoVK/Ycf46/Vps4 family AAA+-type ATPase